MKINTRLVIILIIVFLIGWFIVKPLLTPKKTETQNSYTVKPGILSQVLTISGKIDADEKISLQFPTGGRIAWVGVKEGDYVQKYQSIASLDQRQLQKTLDKYLNDYLKYRDTYDQTVKDDYKDKVITDSIKRVIEKSQADLNKSVLDVEIQNLSVEFANLWTPIEGLVTNVTAPFAGVNIYLPSQAVFDIVNPKTVYFSATADQDEVTKVRENTPASLILDSYPETTMSGMIKTVSFIPKTGESATVYEVKFYFDQNNDNYKYKIGMAGDLSIETQRKENVLYVPLTFLKEDKTGKYVNLKNQNKSIMQYVQTGMETDELIEITSGLKENDLIYD